MQKQDLDYLIEGMCAYWYTVLSSDINLKERCFESIVEKIRVFFNEDPETYREYVTKAIEEHLQKKKEGNI